MPEIIPQIARNSLVIIAFFVLLGRLLSARHRHERIRQGTKIFISSIVGIGQFQANTIRLDPDNHRLYKRFHVCFCLQNRIIVFMSIDGVSSDPRLSTRSKNEKGGWVI